MPVNSVSIKKRYINEKTNVQFTEAIARLPIPIKSADSVDALLDNFNTKILNVIDHIAPAKVKRNMSKQKSPWRTTMPVNALKRECRKAERKWRKTKLHIHYDIYKQSLGNFNIALRKARQLYISEMINNSINNTRTLFIMVDKLMNPIQQIPSEFASTMKCNEFACFFSAKIKNIRRIISITQSNNDSVPPLQAPRQNLVMSHFNVINQKFLEEIVRHLKSSTCCLDIAYCLQTFLKQFLAML